MSSPSMREMSSYDEDLMTNKFFTSLVKKCPELYSTATANRWIICVPRSGCVWKTAYTDMDFQNHVLIPDESDPHQYKTVHGKYVTVRSSTITTSSGFAEIRAVPILFEETFFNENQESYRIICLASLLEGGAKEDDEESLLISAQSRPQSFDDCKDLLWGHAGNNKTQRQVDEVIEVFNRSVDRLQGETLSCYADAANAMFTKAMQIVLKDHVLKTAVRSDRTFVERIKIAVETYTMHNVYRKLFKGISACLASADTKLNKITRNLSHIQLRDLSIRPEFADKVPRARRELSTLVKYSTPMGKMLCIRRVIVALMQPTNRNKPETTTSEPPQEVVMTTDDLLPILIFMVIKSQIANWSSHLCYMNTFRFSKSNNDDEFGFYLASIEAALEHLSSGQLKSDQLGLSEPPATLWTFTKIPSGGSAQSRDPSRSPINKLFEKVRSGDLEAVRNMIKNTRDRFQETEVKLCHPLCSCDNCENLMSSTRSQSDDVTVFSRDDRGCTALHIAAIFGHVDVLEVLIKYGGVVGAADYHGYTPLHLACQRGHQSVTLLLLHYNADPNIGDNDGNRPLHLAAANGHEDCVKALVYYDQTRALLNVNAANDVGDTPLHHAARWGYETIIEILLENGASVEAINRKKQTPVNCAHSTKSVKLLLELAQKNNSEYHNVNYIRVMTPTEAANAARMTREKLPATTPGPDAPNKRNSTPQLYTQSPTRTQLDRVFRAIVDGDLPMVKYLLKIPSESESDEDEIGTAVSERELCHPLCQCSKCQPLQRRKSLPSSRDLSVFSANFDGLTCLHVAALHGQYAIVDLLIKHGAVIDARNRSMHATPLHVACQYNKPDVVKLLLNNGSKIDQRDNRSNTPLHFCGMNGCVEAATILLEGRANVNAVNGKGDTPLHESARWNMTGMVGLLLDHGADVTLQNKSKLTPIQLAQSDDMVQILEQAHVLHEEALVRSQEELAKTPPSGSEKSPIEDECRSTHETNIESIFSALETVDLTHRREISQSIRAFDRRASLRSTVTRDRSSPNLDFLLKHHMAIRNFDWSSLRHTGAECGYYDDSMSERSTDSECTGARSEEVPIMNEEMGQDDHHKGEPVEAGDLSASKDFYQTIVRTRLSHLHDPLHEPHENSNTESADEL